MKFWDASAIVPLLVLETQIRQLQSMAAKDSSMLVWWGSEAQTLGTRLIRVMLSERQRYGFFVFTRCVLLHCNWRRLS
jgi:hypothetical protein